MNLSPLYVQNISSFWNIRKNEYLHDICFVGNLYEESLYDDYVQTLPEILRKYFDSIFQYKASRFHNIQYSLRRTIFYAV